MTLDTPRVIAFYSYKGGVGRSMALAHTGKALAQRGNKVLLIDFDLEAPGLHHIDPFDKVAVPASKGVIELLKLYAPAASDAHADTASPPNWSLDNFATVVWSSDTTMHAAGSLSLMVAGGGVWHADPSAYAEKLGAFDWSHFYKRAGDFAMADILKCLGKRYNVVLIDSRTGLSDPFYVALSLAFEIVVVTGFNKQNIQGTRETWQRLNSDLGRAQFGNKRFYFVGSPEPDMDPIRWTQWESQRKASDWPDFPGFVAKLPYYKEFALREQLLAPAHATTAPIEEQRYLSAIESLCDALNKPQAPSTSETKTIEPSNPFDFLRADYADIQVLMNYFIDPGKELLRAMQIFKPVVMSGARGSGKTMLARYFSYEREASARQVAQNPLQPKDAPTYLGLYLRLDIDALKIFNPPVGANVDLYHALFGQFFDLLVFRKALEALNTFGGLAAWCGGNTPREAEIYATLLRECGPEAKAIPPTAEGLQAHIKTLLSQIRNYLNNPDRETPPWRIQGNILLKLLVEELLETSGHMFSKHYFAVIVDEYEHFSEAQQKVVNGRIKQLKESDHTTYRIFVKHSRSGGLHTTATWAEGQVIQAIHDFNIINLDEDDDLDVFKNQLQQIAQLHLKNNPFFHQLGIAILDQLLQSESVEEQARRIIADNFKPLHKWVTEEFPTHSRQILAWLKQEPRYATRAVALVIMNQGQASSAGAKASKQPLAVIQEFKDQTARAKDWLHNYERGSMYWLARLYANPKALMYAGPETLMTLSGRNVRTFLELCRAIVEAWFDERGTASIDAANLLPPISVPIQNRALRRAGENYRGLIRALPVHSRELLNLTDRLGQLFSAISESPRQSEPEINHFNIEPGANTKDWYKWFETAYAESILVRLKGNKQKSDTDIQQDDWQLHPCFAPHYEFSPRRKKKLSPPLSHADMQTLFSGSDADVKRIIERYKKKYDASSDDSQTSFLDAKS